MKNYYPLKHGISSYTLWETIVVAITFIGIIILLIDFWINIFPKHA